MEPAHKPALENNVNRDARLGHRSMIQQAGISRMASASSQDIYFLEEDELDRYEYEPALEEWLLAKCDMRALNREETEAMIQLQVQQLDSGLDVTQKIALDALERRSVEWRTCSQHWFLDFLRERQGLS